MPWKMMGALALCSIAALLMTWRDAQAQAPQPNISTALIQHVPAPTIAWEWFGNSGTPLPDCAVPSSIAAQSFQLGPGARAYLQGTPGTSPDAVYVCMANTTGVPVWVLWATAP